MELSFWSFVFWSFCVFVFLCFCLFVILSFVFLSFCLLPFYLFVLTSLWSNVSRSQVSKITICVQIFNGNQSVSQSVSHWRPRVGKELPGQLKSDKTKCNFLCLAVFFSPQPFWSLVESSSLCLQGLQLSDEVCRAAFRRGFFTPAIIIPVERVLS